MLRCMGRCNGGADERVLQADLPRRRACRRPVDPWQSYRLGVRGRALSSDPVAARKAASISLGQEPVPGCMVLQDELYSPGGIVDLKVHLSFLRFAKLLEVVHPPQGLSDSARRQPLHVFYGTCSRQRSLGLYVDDEDLPVSSALVDEACSSQRSAANEPTRFNGLVADFNHIQRVIVTRGMEQLVDLKGIPVGLREAAVVEGHRLAEGLELLGAARILPDRIPNHARLQLELLQGTLGDLVDVSEQGEVLVQPALHLQVYIMPGRDALSWRWKMPLHSLMVTRKLCRLCRLCRGRAMLLLRQAAKDLAATALVACSRMSPHRCPEAGNSNEAC
mmetsp:Transcript_16909/g.37155  ORF Transcript_16909/g.37155 Transcript_16909/m.37155 type:complete len:334 (+) Transcript_16909:355-1356(+)